MRTDSVINNEIAKLTAALKSPHWNPQTRHTINQQIHVMILRLLPKQVEDRYYEDETAEEYHEGGNDLWNTLDATARWMVEENGYAAPSTKL